MTSFLRYFLGRAGWMIPIAVCGTLLGQLQPIEEDQGATGFGLALRKLGRVGSLLYITAHPDDENNAVLSKLSRGMGLRTGLLTLTRGDGGQNEIGPELFQALGVLRSEELMAIHRFDGVEQFFSRAYEFGYSFSVEETYEKWGHEDTLGDVVRVIRTFRPQIILTLNHGGEGGGQHHQAAARLALEAFRAAGDANRFPSQITQEGLQPWQAERIFEGLRRRRGGDADTKIDSYEIALGEYDPLLGETFLEFGTRARQNHRCQGMNSIPNPAPRSAHYRLADSAVSAPTRGDDFFQGLQTGLAWITSRSPRLASRMAELEATIGQARAFFEQSNYANASKAVGRGLDLVRRAKEEARDPEVLKLLEEEERDFRDAASKGHFLHFEAFVRETRDGFFVPGEKFKLRARVFDRSGLTRERKISIQVPAGWTVTTVDDQGDVVDFEVGVSNRPHFDQPYWYLPDPSRDRYQTRDGSPGIKPFSPPQVTARLDYRSGTTNAFVEIPVQYRWFDAQAAKERRLAVKAVPELSLLMEPEMAVVSSLKPGPVDVDVLLHNNSTTPMEATVRLETPPGWRSEPSSRGVAFGYENEEIRLRFRVYPSSAVGEGTVRLKAVARVKGQEFTQGYQTIAYHHIQTRHLYRPAETAVRIFPFATAEDLVVGWVTGVGDKTDVFTEQMGVTVVRLTEDDLAGGDLSRFDAVVLGVRAYLRKDLRANNHRLLDYAKQGGTLIVQWNKYEFMRAQYAPYPVKIKRPSDRISVEEAPVRILRPEHPALNQPNRIKDEDWEGWVQERGTYMLGEWDPAFVPLIEMEDPRPFNAGPKRGGLLVAHYGKGIYFHAGLAFFRQLPAGVPGAYRLWANILSLGRNATESRVGD